MPKWKKNRKILKRKKSVILKQLKERVKTDSQTQMIDSIEAIWHQQSPQPSKQLQDRTIIKSPLLHPSLVRL